MPRSVCAVFVCSNLFLIAFTSCVDNEPIIDDALVSVVFDYSGEAAEARLSVFANVKSDLDLAAEIRLVNEDAGLEWSCRELTKFQDSAKNDWAGYAAFVAPEGEGIAKGKYVLTYEDSCEREGEAVFFVDYPDALLERIEREEEIAPSDEGEANIEEAAENLDRGDEVLEQLAADGETSAPVDGGTGGAHLEAGDMAEPHQAGESDAAASDQPSGEDAASSAAHQAAEDTHEAAVAAEGAQNGETATLADEGAQEVAGTAEASDEQDEEMSLEVRRKKPAVFKSKTIDEAEAILGEAAQKKIALYSSDRQLLYFGEQEDDTLSRYKAAAFCRTCLCTQDDAVICVFAETPVVHPKGK